MELLVNGGAANPVDLRGTTRRNIIEPRALRRVGGSSVYTVAGLDFSTSRRTLAAEQRLVTTAGYLVMPRMQKVELGDSTPDLLVAKAWRRSDQARARRDWRAGCMSARALVAPREHTWAHGKGSASPATETHAVPLARRSIQG